ncbi:MAG: hypothetical protein COB50_01560 [Thiotrichales bacterium]|nr:MAG: hypothetical protein COB50_01560 [Thiotrichales bacterium]
MRLTDEQKKLIEYFKKHYAKNIHSNKSGISLIKNVYKFVTDEQKNDFNNPNNNNNNHAHFLDEFKRVFDFINSPAEIRRFINDNPGMAETRDKSPTSLFSTNPFDTRLGR